MGTRKRETPQTLRAVAEAMNIWIFNQYARPPDLPGGTLYYDLGRGLVRRGYHVVISVTRVRHSLHPREAPDATGRSKIEKMETPTSYGFYLICKTKNQIPMGGV